MTRLKEDWIHDMAESLNTYDEELARKIGGGLRKLCANVTSLTTIESLGKDEIGKLCPNVPGASCEEFESAAKTLQVAVVPVIAGMGVIGSFADSVAAILRHLGANTYVTDSTDIDGIAEAYERGADVIFAADDNRYIAFHTHCQRMVDNNYATPLGYVIAMEMATGILKDKGVLVIGYGVIGQNFCQILRRKGADVTVLETDTLRSDQAHEDGFKILHDPAGIRQYSYVFDATNGGGWLEKSMLQENVWISAPGVPVSLDEEAQEIFKDRIIHDYLQIGTATMLALMV